MTAPVPQPCQQWRLKLAAAHPADLEPAERAALEAHLATCAACAAVYAAYARMDAAVQHLPTPAPLEDVPSKLLALWAAEDQQAEQTPVPLARKERAMRSNTVDTAPIFPESPAPRRRSRRLVSGVTALAAVLVIALLTVALLASRLNTPHTGPTANPGAASPTPAITASGTPSGPAGGIPIQVYVSKLGQSDVSAVFPLERYVSSTADLEA